MTRWVLKGLISGIKTTRYPGKLESAPGVSPGFPDVTPLDKVHASITEVCPTGAINNNGYEVSVNRNKCIHCFQCTYGVQLPMKWNNDYEWASVLNEEKLGKPFDHSLHIRFVDTGACGACISELEQLNKPYYNMHRLGFFMTPSPRDADILMVAGPVTDHMREPLLKAYEAMPGPKRVIAIGACALSGGIFGPSFISGKGVNDLIPVDIAIPGCPPPPLAIIHGLLLAVRHKDPAKNGVKQ